jgi:quinohemoprotein ethanol dehydrogenase
LRLLRTIAPAAAVALVVVATVAARSLAITPTPPFTPDQLTPNAGADWLTVGGGLSDDRDSSLTQVNASNVAGLHLAYTGTSSIPTKVANALPEEGTPVSYQGVLYSPNSLNQIQAVDGTSGKTLWTYLPQNDSLAHAPLQGSIRGIALGDGMVFQGRTDGDVVAVDQSTGALVWQVKVGDPIDGISFSSAPVYYNGMVIEGATGGDNGGRSFAVALDAKTGAELWRWYVAPGPGEIGFGSWGPNEWQTGGGAIWIYPSIDVDHGLLYLVTGNPVPWVARDPGNNYWTDSVVALHVDTGELAWGYQTVHHDIWDYDVTNPPVLFDLAYNGVVTPAMGVASKTGWVYILNRVTGKPILGIVEKKVPQLKGAAARYENLSKTQPFPVGDAFTSQCNTRKDWPGKAPDGKPYLVGCIFHPYAYVKGQPSFIAEAPGFEGGVDWQPSAYNSTTHDLYVCSIDGPGVSLGALPKQQTVVHPGQPAFGTTFGPPSPKPILNQLVAINMETNKVAWRINQPIAKSKGLAVGQRCTGAMSTDTGLVFASESIPKKLAAYDAASGKLLWQSSALPVAIGGPPITYVGSDGKQYVAALGNDGKLYGFSL